MTIASLADERRRQDKPLVSASLLVTSYAADEAPAASLYGMGDQPAVLDTHMMARLFLNGLLQIGKAARDAGNQAAPVAFAVILGDGVVHTTIDMGEFGTAARRQWLRKSAGLLTDAFEDALAELTPEAGE